MKRKCFILFLLIFSTIFSQKNDDYIKGKILNFIRYEQVDDTTEVLKIAVYKVKIGKNIVEAEIPIYKESNFNISLTAGENIILSKDTMKINNEDSSENNIVSEKYFIVEKNRAPYIYLLGIIFIIITAIISKLKGIKGILSLIITVVFIYKIFIPGITLGYSPILLAVFTALFSSVITIYLATGFNKKGVIALLSTILGVFIAASLSLIFVNLMKLTGYTDTESYMIRGVNLKELISAGIIIGSMGAVMDVAMSISSALYEMATLGNHTKKQLFLSGMEIGGDTIATMMNTLVLAFVSGNLVTTTLIYLQKSSISLMRILNYEEISIEILRSLLGSIGIIVVVPITSYFCSKFYEKNKKY